MKLFSLSKDGGAESRVWGIFFIEVKRLFSAVLLIFLDGSRDAYHSHAFNSVSWVLWGELQENMRGGSANVYRPSFRPVITRRKDFHKVVSKGTTLVLSFRGRWAKFWNEDIPGGGVITLTHGRKVCPQQIAEETT